MPYKSEAQRKAGWASKADGGAGNPNKMLEKMSPALAKISASCKAQAKKKFKVWPSAMLLVGVYVALEVILRKTNV